jgi:ribosomal protein S12 methylthiotransferase accessory factor YcaO
VPESTFTFPLPEGWTEPERVEDVIDADGLQLRRAGLSSSRDGQEVLGSAADAQTSPAARAQFELLERMSILEATRNTAGSFATRTRAGEPAGTEQCSRVFPLSSDPAVWAHARSNGVALHTSWERACNAAELELAERDRVLRAWLGETEPQRLPIDLQASPLSRTRSYEWSAYLFPAPVSDGFSPSAVTVGVFGFPFRPAAPFVLGYGARDTVKSALESATREAVQLLAFLWDEPICELTPEPAPTPMCHLETLQCRDRQALVRRWLGGAHRRYRLATREPLDPAVRFVDITPTWLEGRLHVAKALSDAALPLAFGLAPLTAHLPAELQLHPIA